MGMGSESTADDDAEEVGFNSYNPSSTEMDGMKRIGSGLKYTTWRKIGHFVDLLPSEYEGTFIAMLCFFARSSREKRSFIQKNIATIDH